MDCSNYIPRIYVSDLVHCMLNVTLLGKVVGLAKNVSRALFIIIIINIHDRTPFIKMGKEWIDTLCELLIQQVSYIYISYSMYANIKKNIPKVQWISRFGKRLGMTRES